jgi:hypothetical protein
MLLAAVICAYPAAAQTTTLKPETTRAFDTYVRNAEAQMRQRVSGKKSFLWLDEHADQRAQVISGDLVTENLAVKGGKAPSGMIHDWLGAVFIPGASIEDVTGFFQNPSAQTEYYPELLRAKLLSHEGNRYRIYRRFLKKKVLTAVLDGEFESRYERPDESRGVVTEHSTKIVEIENHDTPQEKARPVGEDRGFMWRLNSYWRLQKTENGVLAELRTISLSRSIPTGLGWMIKPFITQIPVESLSSTLRGTRKAVEAH